MIHQPLVGADKIRQVVGCMLEEWFVKSIFGIIQQDCQRIDLCFQQVLEEMRSKRRFGAAPMSLPESSIRAAVLKISLYATGTPRSVLVLPQRPGPIRTYCFSSILALTCRWRVPVCNDRCHPFYSILQEVQTGRK